MSKPTYRILKSFVAFILIISCSVIFTSCGGDDEKKIDCDALEEQLEDLSDDLDDALTDGDCDEVSDIYDDIIDLLEKGEDCEFVEDLIDDIGADDFDELIEFLEGFSDDCTNLDCDASEDIVDVLFMELDDAFFDEDCSAIENIRDELYSELLRAENCPYMNGLIDYYGFSDFDEFLEAVQEISC